MLRNIRQLTLIFGHLQASSEIFTKRSEKFVWALDSLQRILKIFRNLWEIAWYLTCLLRSLSASWTLEDNIEGVPAYLTEVTFWAIFFLLVQMSSIFACGLRFHRKTWSALLVCWFNKACICRQENLHFCMRYFLKTKTKQQKKLHGNVFPLNPKSHAKI